MFPTTSPTQFATVVLAYVAAAEGLGYSWPRIVFRHIMPNTTSQIIVQASVNLPYAITPGTFADVVEHLVPELQRRGGYPSSYEPGTLRQKLFGRGDRLPDEHRGASFRRS